MRTLRSINQDLVEFLVGLGFTGVHRVPFVYVEVVSGLVAFGSLGRSRNVGAEERPPNMGCGAGTTAVGVDLQAGEIDPLENDKLYQDKEYFHLQYIVAKKALNVVSRGIAEKRVDEGEGPGEAHVRSRGGNTY